MAFVMLLGIVLVALANKFEDDKRDKLSRWLISLGVDMVVIRLELI